MEENKEVVNSIWSSLTSVCTKVWDDHKIVLLTTATVVAAVKLRTYYKNKKLRNKWNSAGKDVVVLHGFVRGKTCPNLSPFVLKLETYLRMSNIQYKFDTSKPIGSKGKSPWITLNKKDYTDSQLILEFLGNKFNKNFSSHLSDEQKAAAKAFQIMTDEHLIWGVVWWRIIRDPDNRIFDLLPMDLKLKLLFRMAKFRIKKYLWAQGIGRHSDKEIEEMILKDLEALSLYLGKKSFLMGDKPCEVDCAVFGMISQFVWGTPGSPFAASVQSDYRNLLQYCIRMKEKFWPDWENVLFQSS